MFHVKHINYHSGKLLTAPPSRRDVKTARTVSGRTELNLYRGLPIETSTFRQRKNHRSGKAMVIGVGVTSL